MKRGGNKKRRNGNRWRTAELKNKLHRLGKSWPTAGRLLRSAATSGQPAVRPPVRPISSLLLAALTQLSVVSFYRRHRPRSTHVPDVPQLAKNRRRFTDFFCRVSLSSRRPANR